MSTFQLHLHQNLLAYMKLSYNLNEKYSIRFKGRYIDKMLAEWSPATNARYGDPVSEYFILDVNLRAKIWKGMYANMLVSNLLDQEFRYATNNTSNWIDKGMLGFGRRIQCSVGYKF